LPLCGRWLTFECSSMETVRIFTDLSAVKAVLLAPNPSGKHARWWTRVYGSGIQEVDIVYRPGKRSANADALSRSPLPDSTTGVAEERYSEPLFGSVQSETSSVPENISELLSTVSENPERTLSFAEEQQKDPVCACVWVGRWVWVCMCGWVWVCIYCMCVCMHMCMCHW